LSVQVKDDKVTDDNAGGGKKKRKKKNKKSVKNDKVTDDNAEAGRAQGGKKKKKGGVKHDKVNADKVDKAEACSVQGGKKNKITLVKAGKEGGGKAKRKRRNQKKVRVIKKPAQSDEGDRNGSTEVSRTDSIHLKYLDSTDDRKKVQKRCHSNAYHVEKAFLEKNSSHTDAEIKRLAQAAAAKCLEKWHEALEQQKRRA
jgi:hypothetical protein